MNGGNLNEINTTLNAFLNSGLISALLGSLVGGLITWWVTSSSLKKQFRYQNKIAKEEKTKKLIEALVSVKSEVKSNVKNLDDFTLGMENSIISLKEDLFSNDKFRKYRDAIEIEKGEEFIDEISECFEGMYRLCNIEDLVYIFVNYQIKQGKKIQDMLDKEIKEQRKNINYKEREKINLVKLLNKLLEKPISLLSGFLDNIINESRTPLKNRIDEIIKEEIDNNGKYDRDNTIRRIDKFYNNEINKYCSDKELDLLEEITMRKNEITNDKGYIISILTGIVTGVLATLITSFMPKVINMTLNDNSIVAFIGSFLVILFCIILIIFMVSIKFVINYFRKDLPKYVIVTENYELELINKLIDKEIKSIVK